MSSIADELDAMLQGQDNAPASQAQIDGQGDDGTNGTTQVTQPTPEEIEFNSLEGSARDRFKRVTKENKDLKQRLTNLERMNTSYIPPAPGSNFTNPDEQAAIQTLANKGIATDEKVNATVDNRVNQLRWELEQNRLESRYDGTRKVGDITEPQYVRDEVEDFITSHPQYRGYAAEDVFRFKMFPDEFMNLEVTRRGTKTGKSSTLKPTASSRSQEPGMSLEYIADRTDSKKYPDALQWQEEHKAEIDKVLSTMQQQ